jgi:release factor glutamine methyltransferase
MKIDETLKWASEKLKQSCERPRFEAELLLAYHLKKDRTYLHAFDTSEVRDVETYKALVERRAKHEPYEYIVGEASFYDIELNVEAGVLIPRPETEILIDLVAEIIEKENIINIAEVGVGSGAISIVLARKFPNLKVIATDICDTPIKVARENSEKYNVANRVNIIKSNILDEVSVTNNSVTELAEVELVVSNPPYIAEDFILKSNVVDYEPKEALFGGRVGDELLRQIVLDVKKRNIKYLACEMGYDQKEPMTQFFNEIGVKYYKFYKDLAGVDRGFVVTFT